MRRRRERTDRGAAAVEFALILIPIVLILFGLVQYGLYFYSAQTGSNAVNAAVRQLAVGNCQGANQLRDYVDNELGAAKTDTHAQTTVVWKKFDNSPATAVTDAGVGGNVTLTISFHSVNMHFPLVPFLSDSWVDRRAQARVEDIADQGCGS